MGEPGIILALSRAPEAGPKRDEWHLWYDDEHIPDRLTMPGMRGVTRYRDHGDPDAFAAVYEVADVDAAAQSLGEQPAPSASEQAAGASTAPVDLRWYREVGWEACKASYVPGSAPILLVVGMTMQDGYHDEMVEWYEQEHTPMLLKVDGWQRVRRFLKVSGSGSEHLALHEIASHAVFDDPVKAAAQTPWREEVAQRRALHERVIYEVWRRFPAST